MGSMEVLLEKAGFANISVDIKEESREVIAQWMPGSGAEDYVVSANISATKPFDKGFMTRCPPAPASAPAASGCCSAEAGSGCC